MGYHEVCDLSVSWGMAGETIPFEKLEDICVGWKENDEMPVWHEDAPPGEPGLRGQNSCLRHSFWL